MPTGYTHGVETGEITDFREYALRCARNFGACIMLRDEPLSSEIPEFKPSDYYADSLAEASRELAEFLAMNESERRVLHAMEQAKNAERAAEGIADAKLKRDRYEAMLEKARAFRSPSDHHDSYAKFLVDQLTSSIEFDCSTDYWDSLAKPVPFELWEKKKLETLHNSVSWRAKENLDEINRTRERNEWVRKLKEALASYE